jgi:hypothetical protein
MATYATDSLSGGNSAGGIFNLSDADLIELITDATLTRNLTDATSTLISSGAVPSVAGETWGVVVS